MLTQTIHPHNEAAVLGEYYSAVFQTRLVKRVTSTSTYCGETDVFQLIDGSV